MNRLFWKIFLSFWVATILIVVALGWIHHSINVRYGASPLPDQLQFMLRGTAEQAADFLRRQGRRSGRPALEHWLRRPRPRLVEVFAFDSKGYELLGRELPPRLEHLAAPGEPPNRQSSPRHYALTTRDQEGRLYRIVAVSSLPPRALMAPNREGLWVRTLVAMVISALVCWVLARRLTRPIQRLSWAARAMAEGNLSARAGQPGEHGRDELGQLAAEFDRMAGRLEHSLNLQRGLLVDVSHELRSPLARLQIATELARQRSTGEATPEFDRIDREIGKLDELIGEILELSRSGSGDTRLERQRVDLVELLSECVETSEIEARDRALKLSVNTPESLDGLINAALIGRAIDNVLRNALRHAPEGSAIDVTLAVEDEQAVVVIADRGPGVADDQLEAIFRPFYRVGEARERSSGGYGLGLAIARSALERHGGTIQACNRENGGLAVTLRWPLSAPA